MGEVWTHPDATWEKRNTSFIVALKVLRGKSACEPPLGSRGRQSPDPACTWQPSNSPWDSWCLTAPAHSETGQRSRVKSSVPGVSAPAMRGEDGGRTKSFSAQELRGWGSRRSLSAAGRTPAGHHQGDALVDSKSFQSDTRAARQVELFSWGFRGKVYESSPSFFLLCSSSCCRLSSDFTWFTRKKSVIRCKGDYW